MSVAPINNRHNPTPAPSSPLLGNPGTNPSHPQLWLWQNRIPRVGLTILEGPTSIGKTLCALTIAASVSRGLMPDNTPCPQGTVFYISEEDSFHDFLRPVIQRADAHLPSVHLVRCAFNFDGSSFALLEKTMKEERPRLIVIDSIRSTIGRLAKLTEERLASILHRLFALAWTHEVAVLLIRITDLKGHPSAQTRAEKSPHLTAAAHSILLLSPDTTDPGSVLLSQSKCMLAADTPTLSFRVTSDPAHHDPFPSLHWSLAPNLSGSDLCYLQHTGSLPHPDLSDTVLAIMRDHLDESLGCRTICKLLGAPDLKPNMVSQTLGRLEKRGLLTKPSYALYSLLSRPPADNQQSISSTTKPVKVSNSATKPAKVSNSATKPAKVSNSADNPALSELADSANLVKVSNSASTLSSLEHLTYAEPVKVSNSPDTLEASDTSKLVRVSNSADVLLSFAVSNSVNPVKMSNSADILLPSEVSNSADGAGSSYSIAPSPADHLSLSHMDSSIVLPDVSNSTEEPPDFSQVDTSTALERLPMMAHTSGTSLKPTSSGKNASTGTSRNPGPPRSSSGKKRRKR